MADPFGRSLHIRWHYCQQPCKRNAFRQKAFLIIARLIVQCSVNADRLARLAGCAQGTYATETVTSCVILNVPEKTGIFSLMAGKKGHQSAERKNSKTSPFRPLSDSKFC